MGDTAIRQGRRATVRFSTAHLVAVAAGLTAAVLLLTWTRSQERVIPVVVAAHDIAAGVGVDTADLAVVEIPAGTVLAGSLTSADQLETLAGRVTTRSIARSEPVLASDTRPAEADTGVRAMSFPLSAANAVGGDLSPGDRVDVLVVTDDATRYVATGVPVLAIPESQAAGLATATSAWWVTLGVDDAQALEIADGSEHGTIYVLRSNGAPAPRITELEAEPDAPAEAASVRGAEDE